MIDFNTIKDLYLANNEVEELYINGSKVWEKGGAETSMPLTFRAEEANSTVRIEKVGSSYLQGKDLMYSTDNGETWTGFSLSSWQASPTFTLTNVGDTVMLKANGTFGAYATSTSNYYNFKMTGRVAAGGNILSLLDSDFENVTSVPRNGFMCLFKDCTALTKAPDLMATSVDYAGYKQMFNGCTSLTSTPRWASQTITFGAEACRQMFQKSSALTTIIWPENVVFNGEMVFEGAFGLTGLVHAVIPYSDFGTANAVFGYVFDQCPNLLSVSLPNYVGNMNTSMNSGSKQLQYFADRCPQLTTANFPSLRYAGHMLLQYAFKDDPNFTTVNMPLLEQAHDQGLRQMFLNCTALTSVSLPSLARVQYETCDHMFQGCSSLTTISMPSLAYVGYHGCYCLCGDAGISTLRNVDLSSLHSVDKGGMASAFEGSGLVVAPSLPATALGAECYSAMFRNCQNMTTPPPSLPATEVINNSYYEMFANCTSLTSAPQIAATYAEGSAFRGMFKNCSAMTGDIDMDSLTTLYDNDQLVEMFRGTAITSISMQGLTTMNGGGINSCFRDCTSLVSADFRNLERITGSYGMGEAFYGCTSLETVRLDKFSYDDFGIYSSFQYCSALEVVDFTSATSVPSIYTGDSSLGLPFDNASADYQIVVPDSLYSQWIAASGWSDASIVDHIVQASDYVPAA